MSMRLFTKKQDVVFSSDLRDDITTETKLKKRRILRRHDKSERKFSLALLSLTLVISILLGLVCGGYFTYKNAAAKVL